MHYFLFLLLLLGDPKAENNSNIVINLLGTCCSFTVSGHRQIDGLIFLMQCRSLVFMQLP